MFNIGFLWLALSIGSEITGTSMIKKTNNYTKKDPPRFFIVNKIDPKPEEIKEQGDELMKNRFEVMKVLPDSDDLIWFISIKDPPRGKVLLRWKPD